MRETLWNRALSWVMLPAAGLALGLLPGSAGAAGAGVGAGAAPVEVNYQDPMTAAPPLRRPDTAHCTVPLMRHDFAFSFGQPFVGTLTPPAGCPGANLAADGSDSERFIARSGDACFDHLLRADHGFFTVDRTTGCG